MASRKRKSEIEWKEYRGKGTIFAKEINTALYNDRQNSGRNSALRNYYISERQWVMEALPTMSEYDWERYTEWVKSAGDPLPRKGAWVPLKKL